MERVSYDVIINEILNYLDDCSIYNFSLTNREYLNILRDQQLWKKRFARKLQIKLDEVPNDIDFNDYKLLPEIICKIKEIKSAYCLYVYQRGSKKSTRDMSPTTSDSNYCRDCNNKLSVHKNPAYAYVSIDNNHHQEMPEFVKSGVKGIVTDIKDANKVIGKYWQYNDQHSYIIKE